MKYHQVKFALITDVHIGNDDLHRDGEGPLYGTFGSQASLLLRRFVREMNTRFKPDFVVSLGDVIHDESAQTDRGLLKKYHKLLSNLHAPIHYVIGNHDVKNLTDREIKECLGIKRFYYAFDYERIRCIVLYSFARRKKKEPNLVLILKKQLNWLRSECVKSNKPLLIFNHYPVDEQDIRTNPYWEFFRKFPWRAAVVNRADVRRVLEKSKKVLAVFSGHLHWQKKSVIKGIPYYSIPSLTEMDRGEPSGEWAEIIIRNSKISIKIKICYNSIND